MWSQELPGRPAERVVGLVLDGAAGRQAGLLQVHASYQAVPFAATSAEIQHEIKGSRLVSSLLTALARW